MKKMIITLIAMLTITVQASMAMSYEQARNEALFLTDKMAYELNLTDAQYEAAYEINLDYLMSVTGYHDVNGIYWERRNADLRFILYSWQWDAFCAATYFFRPLYWDAGYWHFGVYARYPRRDYFYFGRPHFYASYRGGHSWHRNGGRSYYEHRRDIFRPGNVHRDHHIGMRNGFDRGDYRGAAHGNSSTRVTAGERHIGGSRNGGYLNGNGRGNGTRDNGTYRNGSRSSSQGGRTFGEGSRQSSGSFGEGSSQGGRSFGGSSNSSRQSSGSFGGGSSQGGRSFGGGSNSSRQSSGSFGSTRSSQGSISHGESPRTGSHRR